MAEKTVCIMMEGEAIVNAFQFDETTCIISDSDLQVKVFDDYTVEWAEFIVSIWIVFRPI